MILLEAKLSVAAARTLAPVLRAVTKHDDALNIMTMPDKMTLFASYLTHSACMRAVFYSHFFDEYSTGAPHMNEPTQLPLADRWDEGSANISRVLSKPLYNTLRRLSQNPLVEDLDILIYECDGNDLEDIEPDWLQEERSLIASSLFLRANMTHGVTCTHRFDLLSHEADLLVPRRRQNAALSPHVIISPIAAQVLTAELASCARQPDGFFIMSFKPDLLSLEGSSAKIGLSKELHVIGDDLNAYQPKDTFITLNGHILEFSAMLDLAAKLKQSIRWSYGTPPEPLVINIPPTAAPDSDRLEWFVETFVAVSEGLPHGYVAATQAMVQSSRPLPLRLSNADESMDKENLPLDGTDAHSQNTLDPLNVASVDMHEAASNANDMALSTFGREDLHQRLDNHSPTYPPAAKRRRLMENTNDASQISHGMLEGLSHALPGCSGANDTAPRDYHDQPSRVRRDQLDLASTTPRTGRRELTQDNTPSSPVLESRHSSSLTPLRFASPLWVKQSPSSTFGGSQPTAGPARRSLKKDAVPFSSLISLDDLPDDLPDGGFLPLLHSSLDSAHSSLSHVTSEPSHVQPLYHFSSANASLPAVYASLDDEAEDLNQNEDD